MMTRDEAAARLVEVLPEFRSELEAAIEYDEGDLLLHPLMGDLARFYMRERGDADLRRRYWRVVEELAANGDDGVNNAVHVSLIEWFAWGSPEEVRALDDARELQGPATRAIREHYR
jgi:hypothetical protein